MHVNTIVKKAQNATPKNYQQIQDGLVQAGDKIWQPTLGNWCTWPNGLEGDKVKIFTFVVRKMTKTERIAKSAL